MASEYMLEDVKIYPYPNAALAEILVGPSLKSVMIEYTGKVVTHYVTSQQSAGYKDTKRQTRQGGHVPGASLRSISASVDVGGFKHDRWVGEISVGTEYSGATEFGRHAYAQYQGNHALANSLYSVLPTVP